MKQRTQVLSPILICFSFYFSVNNLWAQDNESPPDEPPYNVRPAVKAKPLETKKAETDELQLTDSPESDQPFVKPSGPPQGGILRVPHPGAAKGLSRINADGSYQYRIPQKSKSQSSSLRLGVIAPPNISGAKTTAGTKSFGDFYGSSGIFAVNFDYEWQPFSKFGRVGLVLGTGFATARGNGYFKKDGTRAEEVYNLYIVPMSAFLNYRFEYARRQWAVPFVKAGGTYFGMVELRDDNKSPAFAAAPAVGGGGGIHFSITALDKQEAFILDREYGIADMYLTLEAQALQGLSSDIDFSTQMVNLGITVDF